MDAIYKQSNNFDKKEELDLVYEALQGGTCSVVRSQLR